MRTIGQDCLCSLYDGGAQSPTGATYGSAIPIKAFAKAIKLSDKLTTKSVRGLGDQREKKRSQFGESEVHITLFIKDTGPVSGITLGNYTKFTFQNHANAGIQTYAGLLVDLEQDIPDDAQTQEIVIDCDAE